MKSAVVRPLRERGGCQDHKTIKKPPLIVKLFGGGGGRL